MNDEYLNIENLITIRRYDQAREHLEIAIQATPDNPYLFHLSAYLYSLESDIESGIEAAQSGLALDPNNEALRFDLFDLLDDNQQYSEAELIIIDLIKENPRDTDYLRSYSSLMLFTFHLNKARLLINEALRIDPDDKNSQLIEVLIDISAGNLKDSEQRLAQLVKDSPESEHIIRLLLLQLLEQNKYRAALQLSQELLRTNPYDQGLIDSIIEIKAATHWTAWPVWPIRQFGWIASIGLWLGFILLTKLDDVVQLPWFKYVIWSYLSWCIYTWLHSPIMNRWFKFKGV